MLAMYLHENRSREYHSPKDHYSGKPRGSSMMLGVAAARHVDVSFFFYTRCVSIELALSLQDTTELNSSLSERCLCRHYLHSSRENDFDISVRNLLPSVLLTSIWPKPRLSRRSLNGRYYFCFLLDFFFHLPHMGSLCEHQAVASQCLLQPCCSTNAL